MGLGLGLGLELGLGLGLGLGLVLVLVLGSGLGLANPIPDPNPNLALLLDAAVQRLEVQPRRVERPRLRQGVHLTRASAEDGALPLGVGRLVRVRRQG